MRTISRILGLLLLPALLTTMVWAQGGATGAITGQVVDPSGAVVPGAAVRIVNHATGQVARTLKTEANGSFTALLLPVATYDVTVSAPGFAQGTVNNVDVRITETTRMTAKLVPQTVQQEVEVQAEVQTVETTTATTGEAIESNTIRTLPLATQNFQQLLSLSAGASSQLNASAQLGRGDVRIIVNGQREDNNNYLVEGITATDYNVAELTNTPLPNPDVVQEFKVQTSLYDASQGRNGGATSTPSSSRARASSTATPMNSSATRTSTPTSSSSSAATSRARWCGRTSSAAAWAAPWIRMGSSASFL